MDSSLKNERSQEEMNENISFLLKKVSLVVCLIIAAFAIFKFDNFFTEDPRYGLNKFVLVLFLFFFFLFLGTSKNFAKKFMAADEKNEIKLSAINKFYLYLLIIGIFFSVTNLIFLKLY